MKVYVVTIGWDYEGEQVAGVHVTAESAHAHAKSLQAERPVTCDIVTVQEWVAGGEAAEAVTDYPVTVKAEPSVPPA